MAKNFRELRSRMPSGARAASDAEHRRLVEEMSLYQLRKARELTQTKIAEELQMGQGDVSKLERRTECTSAPSSALLRHLGGIANYCETKVRFGVVEAVNGNIRMLINRGRGYKNLRYLLLQGQADGRGQPRIHRRS